MFDKIKSHETALVFIAILIVALSVFIIYQLKRLIDEKNDNPSQSVNTKNKSEVHTENDTFLIKLQEKIDTFLESFKEHEGWTTLTTVETHILTLKAEVEKRNNTPNIEDKLTKVQEELSAVYKKLNSISITPPKDTRPAIPPSGIDAYYATLHQLLQLRPDPEQDVQYNKVLHDFLDYFGAKIFSITNDISKDSTNKIQQKINNTLQQSAFSNIRVEIPHLGLPFDSRKHSIKASNRTVERQLITGIHGLTVYHNQTIPIKALVTTEETKKAPSE